MTIVDRLARLDRAAEYFPMDAVSSNEASCLILLISGNSFSPISDRAKAFFRSGSAGCDHRPWGRNPVSLTA
ncbi:MULTISPECIES: hypothetical protein [Methylobacterium]|uniref:hypothetical protein n=1 Tax=Methylobacterium TaxID=407 RepID=UPI0013EA86E4|nr:hypothetical protein [Methylobacterium sp. DB0501]NGM37192.1 hypothetical protein [Methylobacterium sp. DB0501]